MKILIGRIEWYEIFSLAPAKFSALQPFPRSVEREPPRGGSFLITPRDKNEFSFASIRSGNLIISPRQDESRDRARNEEEKKGAGDEIWSRINGSLGSR